MGLRGWVDNLKGVTKAVQANRDAGAPGPGEADAGATPTTGLFEPIEGVDLETFTRVSHGLTSRGVTEEGPVLAYVAEQGLDPAQWKTVADGWNDRIINDLTVKQRFGQLYFALDGTG